MTAKSESVQAAGGPGRARQAAIFRAGARGRMPSIPTDAPTLERRAKKAMSRTAWAYVAGGAGEGRTMRHNRESFERWRIVPRMLRGTPQRDLTTSVVGTQLSAPVLLAPIGAASIVVPNSDVITAQGAVAAGTAYVISCQGCNPLEETAAAMNPWPFWYQLYWSTDETLVDSMISRAERCGAGALVVTLDTTILGWPRGISTSAHCHLSVDTASPNTRLILASSRSFGIVLNQPQVVPGLSSASAHFVHWPRYLGNIPAPSAEICDPKSREPPLRHFSISTQTRGCPGSTLRRCGRERRYRSC